MYDVVVVGGGSAGLMAAGRAAQNGAKVLLLEKNKKLGEKLRISGGGRCNVTNAEEDERALLRQYGKAEQFLYSAFAQFGVKDTFSFFDSRGLPLVVEARKRAFPETKKAGDVCRVLEEYARSAGVEIRLNSAVTQVEHDSSGITALVCGKEKYSGAHYIFATGGVSHPETGSTGEGFSWLADLGHTVAKPTPGIVPLRAQESWIKKLAGKSLGGVKITFFVEGKKKFSKTGAILCTHFGLSGPTILNSAVEVGNLLHEGVVTASIDLFPSLDMGSVEKKMVVLFDANKNKMLKNVIKEILPVGTSESLLTLAPEVPPETKVHSITKEQRKVLARVFKALPVSVEGLMGFDRAVIADGGVALTEVDTKTMRSKKVSNLSIVGDLLHINRPSGGYSLQLCWSTGFVAGEHARKP